MVKIKMKKIKKKQAEHNIRNHATATAIAYITVEDT